MRKFLKGIHLQSSLGVTICYIGISCAAYYTGRIDRSALDGLGCWFFTAVAILGLLVSFWDRWDARVKRDRLIESIMRSIRKARTLNDQRVLEHMALEVIVQAEALDEPWILGQTHRFIENEAFGQAIARVARERNERRELSRALGGG